MSYEIRLVTDEGLGVSYVGHFEGKPPAWLKKLDGKAAPSEAPDADEAAVKLATAVADSANAGPLYVQVI